MPVAFLYSREPSEKKDNLHNPCQNLIDMALTYLLYFKNSYIYIFMLLNKRIFIVLTAFLLAFSFTDAHAAEHEAAADGPEIFYGGDDPAMSDEESLLRERPALPPMLPPSNMTPDQVRQFFSKPAEEEEYIILNFDNADIKDVLATVSTITGENFILGSKVGGKITIHSSEKIPVSEVLTVFESVLEVNSMALVRSGDFFKVVQTTAARQMPLEIFKGNDPDAIPYGDRPVTQLILLDHVPVREMTTVLKPMLSKTGLMTPNPRLNMLIVSDLASNIRRLLAIINEVDVDAFESTRMAFVQLRNSDVATLSRELTNIINALNIGKDGIAIVPIERLNSLVIFSSGPGLLKTAKAWIKKLDDELTTGQNIFVYHVQNVEAKKIASVLKNIYVKSDTRPVSSSADPAPKATKKSASFTSARNAQTAVESGRVEIDTFDATNSLVILASPGLYKDIKETIKKLDLYPKEVLIEVIIAEVNLENNSEYGIQWSVLHNLTLDGDSYSALAEGPSNPSISTSPFLTGAGEVKPPALGGGVGGLTYYMFNADKLAAMFNAIASRSKVNILSSPRLLVRDKEEASIDVGKDIPIATSTTQQVSTSTTQNIEYKTVGIKLKIKPSINDEKTVVLDIEQEVSDVLEDNQTVGEFTYPAFTTTLTKTSVVVPDKQGIIIGGLMREKKGSGYSGIPLLSSIPYLGSLFRYTVNSKEKTELIMILRPHVISNRTEADVVTSDFIEKLKVLNQSVQESDIKVDIFEPYYKDEADK